MKNVLFMQICKVSKHIQNVFLITSEKESRKRRVEKDAGLVFKQMSMQTGAGARSIFNGGVLSEALTRVSPSAL